jgi:predicted ATPase/DNA-binding SARP family transcriptional activator
LSVTTDEGREVEIGGARLRTLLARLALDAPRLVSTTELIDGLWEVPPGDAANALQSLISRLRKALRAAGIDDGLLQSQPSGYRLAEAEVDAHRFLALAEVGRGELRAGRAADAAMTLRAALALFRGSPLAGIGDAPFGTPAIARLTEARLTAIEDRIAAELVLGRHTDVLPELDELCAAHPLREPLAALRLRALSGAGRQADALAGYAAIRQELAEELGVDPSPELQQVHLALLRGEAEPARSPVALADPPKPAANLHGTSPARLTSFIGRDSELATALDLLGASRLVCLVGPGGAGKTRLATEIARGIVDRDGVSVWFAELAPIRDGGDLAESLLAALGLREVRIIENAVGSAGVAVRTPLSRLVEHFTGAPAVLVLDNCEHLIDAAATLAETLLGSCPELRVLATSREPLAITGEALHWVGPLDLPGEHATPEQASRTSAVRLFVDRAMAARPGFALDTTVLPAVAEICHRLDGMPLALELAAARLRSMSPQEVAERLDDRFALFTGGNRTAMPRHRTLRGVVEWSWDLLTEAEATLARRLALFAGGITVASAIGVCAGAGLSAVEVPYLLASLVEKSLLEAKTDADGSSRYRMLETVRAYGQEKLAEAGEADTAMTAFVEHFARVVMEQEPVLRTREQLTAVAVLTADHDNIGVALRWAAENGKPELIADLVLAMLWYWIMAGRPREAMTWSKLALAAQPAEPTVQLAALRLVSLMSTFEEQPLDEALVDTVDATLGLLGEEAINRYPVCSFLQPMLLMFIGRPDEAMASARRLSGHPDPWARGFSRLCVCFVAENNGDADTSAEALADALDALREIGERWALCFALSMDGSLRSLRGDYAGAIRAHEEALAMSAELGSADDALQQRAQLGRVRLYSGDVAGAEHDLRIVLENLTELDGPDRADIQFFARCAMVGLACAVGDLVAAREHLEYARTYRISVPMSARGHRMAALMICEVAIDDLAGDLDQAHVHAIEALRNAVLSRDMPLLAGVGERIARLLTRVGGRAVEAAGVLGASAGLRGLLDQGDPQVRDTIEKLAGELGEQGYATAFRAGRELDRPAAILYLHTALGVSPE